MSRSALSRSWLWLSALLLWACVAPAWAQSRLWLDRDRIALDESVVLHLRIDASRASGIPDMTALTKDFSIVERNIGRDVALVNGEISLRFDVVMTLRPQRMGTIEIPRMRIGQDVVGPLLLEVLPPKGYSDVLPSTEAATPPEVFIDSKIDSTDPYVQQTVGYTVFLYYELSQMLGGRLDQDTPEGATVRQVGDDIQHVRQVGNRLYNVLERRYLLIPERSGTINVPGARFLGRSSGGFSGGRGDLRIRGRATALQVRPVPANAAQPWLPLRNLRLRYLETPRAMRAGVAERVTVELVVDGAVSTQLPALELQAPDHAQIFAEAPQREDQFVDGVVRASVVRTFSILPSEAGTLRIVGPRIEWWDVQAGAPRTATLPDLLVPVSPAAVARPNGGVAAGEGAIASDPWRLTWKWLLLPLAALWIVTLLFIWRLWSMRSGRPDAAKSSADRPDARAWARVLARGDRDEIARVLRAMADPPAADLDEVCRRLADPAQADAVAALQRARWGRGDPAHAVAAMRAAFAQGPRWRMATRATEASPLPPLYPGY